MKTKIIHILSRAFIIIVTGTIITLFVRYEINQVKVANAQQYKSTISALTSKNSNKIEEIKSDVLNRLKECESGTLKISDAPILLDTNHRISIGMFMFQRKTVIYYYHKLYNKTITKREAVEIALSPKARSLASDIIFKERGGIFNWANCAKQKNLVIEVTIIKRIQ